MSQPEGEPNTADQQIALWRKNGVLNDVDAANQRESSWDDRVRGMSPEELDRYIASDPELATLVALSAAWLYFDDPRSGSVAR